MPLSSPKVAEKKSSGSNAIKMCHREEEYGLKQCDRGQYGAGGSAIYQVAYDELGNCSHREHEESVRADQHCSFRKHSKPLINYFGKCKSRALEDQSANRRREQDDAEGPSQQMVWQLFRLRRMRGIHDYVRY